MAKSAKQPAPTRRRKFSATDGVALDPYIGREKNHQRNVKVAELVAKGQTPREIADGGGAVPAPGSAPHQADAGGDPGRDRQVAVHRGARGAGSAALAS